MNLRNRAGRGGDDCSIWCNAAQLATQRGKRQQSGHRVSISSWCLPGFEAYIEMLASTIPEMMRHAASQNKELLEWLALHFGMMHYALRKKAAKCKAMERDTPRLKIHTSPPRPLMPTPGSPSHV